MGPEDYLAALDESRRTPMSKLRKTILENLPKGFVETISYGMIGYVVPHELYPAGYHCDPKLPLPFVSIASQKSHMAFYHSGIYADEQLHNWFVEAYVSAIGKKPDMGKSCVRFKKAEHIPFELIGQLMQKITPQDWINQYESAIKPKGR